VTGSVNAAPGWLGGKNTSIAILSKGFFEKKQKTP